ncbi:MAG: Na/Pi symporter, partial [Candidatus Omnitrophica bacterium]|nr:Na/Pi symporter [Candidatus Omnitrophota bacterium]
LIRATSNPFIGLFIGILATSIVQSSSTTTAIVVGMVGSNVISIGNAIPIIMGANIGTTVTAVLVSLCHVTRREEFKRAITGATVHDFFNILCVSVLFPLQVTTGFLEKLATKMALLFANAGGVKFTSPIKFATKPLINFIKHFFLELNLSQNIIYILILTISVLLLFFCLYFIVRLMKSLIIGRVEIVFNNVLGKHGVLAIIVGILFTAIVQSSSITTSLMVPLVASGILTVEAIFPIVLGANMGTTVTAILASFATGNTAAITVAFAHFLFNTIGVMFFYPLPIFRKIPISLAKGLGNLALKKRRYAFIYVASVFFLIPSILIFISRLFK